MSRPPSGGRRGLFLGAALVIGTLLSTCPDVLIGKTLYLRDLSIFHRPLRRLLLELWSSSDGLPLWNPLSHFGQPFAANPNSAVFDPFSALFFVLPFDLAFNLQVLLPLLIGAAGFAQLVRVRGGSRFAATFGALTWGLGGCALSVSNFLQFHHAACWLPLALAATQRFIAEPTRKRVAALSLCLGAIGLAGSPTGLLLTALLLPAAAWEAWQRRGDEPARPVVARGLVLALLLGGALATATLLPAALLLRDTGRVADESFSEEATGWSLPPARLVELAAPRAFGHVDAETVGLYWGRELYGWREWPYLFSLYGGLAGLVLGLVGAVAWRRRDRPWLVVGGLGLLLSFGAHVPGWSMLVELVPPLGIVRFPEKWAVAPALVLALLAARGFDAVLDDEQALRRARRLAALLGLALLAVFVWLVASGPESWAVLWSVPDWLSGDVAARVLQDFRTQCVLAVALVLVLFVQRMRRLLLPLMLLVLTAVDLALAGHSLLPAEDPFYFDQPPFVLEPMLSAPDDGRTVFLYADWKGQSVRVDGRTVALEAPVPWQWGIATAFEKDFDGTQLAWSRAATNELLPLMAAEPRLVGPVLESRGVDAVLGAAGPGGSMELLATRASRGIAHVVERVVVRGAGESLAAATLRGGGALVLEPGTPAPSSPGPAGLTLRHQAPGRLQVAVDAERDAVVALNVTWHRGWRVRVDGERADLHRANGHLMAIVLPAGEHELELEYREPGVVAGLLVSLGALTLACLAFLPARGRAAGGREESVAE